jgi:hypothetical protein
MEGIPFNTGVFAVFLPSYRQELSVKDSPIFYSHSPPKVSKSIYLIKKVWGGGGLGKGREPGS